MSKRIKINFKIINKGKYTIIPLKEIIETNESIKKNMRKIIRKNNKNLIISELKSKQLIVN